MDFEVIIRFLLAALWGGLVGAEREYNGKAAGFRTMIMISLGSCFFTMMSEWIGEAGSPDRIASNIVTGIGFIGAGVIYRGGHSVHGMTTAATIWAVAAVGMGIGDGYYFASAIASIAVIIILAILPSMEKLIERVNKYKLYTIECQFTPDIRAHLESVIIAHHLKFKVIQVKKEGAQLLMKFHIRGHIQHHKKYIDSMLIESSIDRFEY